MERFGPQLYESDEQSDKDGKADKEKKTKGGSTKAAKSLSSVLRLRSENEEAPKASHQAEVEMKLAFMAGKFTELRGGKSEKPRKQAEAKEAPKQDDERSTAAEEAVQTQDERGAEAVLQETGEPAMAKVSEAEELLKTDSNIEQAEEVGKEKPEAPESFPTRELGPNELGGEVYLTSDKPIKEHVILLRETPANEAVAEVRAAAEVPEEEPKQHQMDSEEPVEEPEPQIPGGGEVPPVKPPENTSEASGEPEEPEEPNEAAPSFEWLSSLGHPESHSDAERPEPAHVYRAYMQQQAAAQQATIDQAASPHAGAYQAEADQFVTRDELEDRVHSASKFYQRKGLLTGLLLGGWYEHRKHKRREKKAEKLAKAKDKQLEDARKDYSFGLQEQERQRAELNARLNVAERRVTVADQRAVEQQLKSQEALARAVVPPERPVVSPEQLAVPPEHRVELSTWLSTEIDKRTGRIVERPTFQYGHEYYRERAQESMPINQRNAAAGAAALMAASTRQAPADGAGLPPADLPSATRQGRPPQAVSQQADDAQNKPSEPIASAVSLWPWVLALVIIIVCLVVALR